MFGLDKNYPDTSTPLNAENLNEMQRNLLDLVYPIGRGFIDFTDTDYSDYLGFEWERELIGMVAVGKDPSQTEFNSIGKTGGSKTHTLTINEMPTHNHATPHFVVQTNAPNYNNWENGISGSAAATEAYLASATTADRGGDQPHNNLQPYKVVNYWKRVA